MKIEGKVVHVIFHNETNGYTIFIIEDKKEEITCVGETFDLELEDYIELEGEYINHKVYGKQFKISTYSKSLPSDNKTLITYIANNVKGIGKKKASLIIDKFGDNSINVISNESYRLRDLKGFTDEIIENLVLFFKDDFEKWNSIKYLSTFGISVNIANKIYNELRGDTITIVKQNPYSLLEFVTHLNFKDIDKIGISQGIDLNNEDRIKSGIIYALKEVIAFGHTCVLKEKLVNYSSSLLKVGLDDIDKVIASLRLEEKVYILNKDSKEYIMLYSLYIAEYNVAEYINSSMKRRVSHKEYKHEIEKVCENDSLVLSKEQEEAIKLSINNNFSVITGGPGTGKTTIIKCIIDILKLSKKSYVLAAPTGRAAKRITEATGAEAKTLHRLLEINQINDNDLDSFVYYAVKDIEKDYVIVDECSMIDTLMMNNLIKSLNHKTKVILVGDVNQLPSVGAGNVLKDIINSNKVPYISLEKIYRQSKESDIVLNAHRVNNGEYMEFKNKDTDLYFINSNNIEEALEEIKSIVSFRLKKAYDIDVLKDLQILTPTKKTELGTFNLNKEISDIINTNESYHKFKNFKVNDKVMQIVNNYDKDYKLGVLESKGIYNGDVGVITEIDKKEEYLTVKFEDDKIVKYEKNELDELVLSYAITIHKSQGSEYPYVVIPLFHNIPKLFTRNLLYTAITRAKKMLIIVGKKECLNYMIDNNKETERLTGFKEHLTKKDKKK